MGSRGATGIGVIAFACAACAFLGEPAALAAGSSLPDPCQIVPGPLIASAFGVKTAPPSTSTAVINATTCSYKGGMLTISVGYTALTNPAPPSSVVKVAGLSNGVYETFAGSTASQLTFYKGDPATATYVVIRNYVRIPQKKLVKIAKTLYGRIGSSGTSGGTLVS
jgi:hypothetical protein